VLTEQAIKDGYYLDEDDHFIYLFRGDKELIATFSAMGATSDQIRLAALNDKKKRCAV